MQEVYSVKPMRRKYATTLQDIAQEAGVSAMTVSVVLNGANSSARVSEGTRVRIQEVAARLHYRPNGVARGLSRRRMDTLGVAAIVDGDEVNLYFLEILNGILEGCAAHGQNTTILSVSDWRRDESKILQFCDGRVDGILCIGPMFSPAFAETLQQHTPFLTLHSNEKLPHVHNLDVDNEGGAYAIVRHLIAQGHRRILHFSADPGRSGAQFRLDGYRRALQESGIAFEEALVFAGEYSSASGRSRMTALLDSAHRASFPTALFCASDAIAYGSMEVLTEQGLRVPQDLSVVGFDDALLARMTTPPLTTVRQPLRRMGRCAVEMLLQQILTPPSPSTPLLPEAGVDVFDFEVILRQSVGPPPVHPLKFPRPHA